MAVTKLLYTCGHEGFGKGGVRGVPRRVDRGCGACSGVLDWLRGQITSRGPQPGEGIKWVESLSLEERQKQGRIKKETVARDGVTYEVEIHLLRVTDEVTRRWAGQVVRETSAGVKWGEARDPVRRTQDCAWVERKTHMLFVVRSSAGEIRKEQVWSSGGFGLPVFPPPDSFVTSVPAVMPACGLQEDVVAAPAPTSGSQTTEVCAPASAGSLAALAAKFRK